MIPGVSVICSRGSREVVLVYLWNSSSAAKRIPRSKGYYNFDAIIGLFGSRKKSNILDPTKIFTPEGVYILPTLKFRVLVILLSKP